ncbi:hypothetical protein LIER_33268 [Lithospermum erythrorhizon]|uniref:Late embryogenesis abundant protein LEA-2 subgroup domain-containing protein n=1 Tax=Lithospermum erythrorhizon TaxID=34254 RepID=A0AAV3RYQ6_LITER
MAADPQNKVHPVPDLEAPAQPTAPLMSKASSRSDHGDPEQPQQAPPVRAIPYKYTKPPKRRSCCVRCLCWTLCFLFLIIVILGILAAVIYFVFDPKVPKYSVDSMRVTQFSVNTDNSLYATFNLNITTRNPNKKIGIYYEGGSNLKVSYSGTTLGEGRLPKFYQGHRNTTVLDVQLTGQTDNASRLLSSLQAQQQTGNIPLRLRAKVPVRIKLGKLKLMKWKFIVKCNLVVDSLSEANNIRISENDCKFRFRF